jgi:hypothetical protein
LPWRAAADPAGLRCATGMAPDWRPIDIARRMTTLAHIISQGF